MEYRIGDLVLMQCEKAGNWVITGVVLGTNSENYNCQELIEVFVFKSRKHRYFFEKDLKLLNNYK